jgi:hypothetical protein
MKHVRLIPHGESAANAGESSANHATIPLTPTGDNGARLALLTTGVMMLLIKKPFPAIAAGIAVAALWRNL